MSEENKLLDLIGEYFDLGYAEGVSARDTDTMAGDAQRVLSEIQAEITALRHERDNFRDMADGYGKLDAEFAASQARLSEAVKVLEPFAAKADTYNEVPGIIRFNDDIELWQLEDNAGMRVDLTVGQLRAARQFLATLGEK